MPRVGPLAVALVLLSSPVAARKSRSVGFVGLTFAGETTFFDAEQAAGGPNRLIGASAVLIGEVVGIEADVGWSPGFFQSGDAEHTAGEPQRRVDGDGESSSWRCRSD
jgi:hypothetical protein